MAAGVSEMAGSVHDPTGLGCYHSRSFHFVARERPLLKGLTAAAIPDDVPSRRSVPMRGHMVSFDRDWSLLIGNGPISHLVVR